jgi:hypothetical protein
MSAYLLGAGFLADMGTPIRKLVLLKVIDACHDDGSRIYPAIETVAKAAQCSSRQVHRELRAFLSVGLLRTVRKGGKGPGHTTEYALEINVLDAIARVGWDSYTAEKGAEIEPDEAENDEIKGDTVSPLENKGDTHDTKRVTPTTPKGDSRSQTTPYYPSSNPSEREGVREISEDDPKLIERQLDALMIGRHGNPWPKVLGSSRNWALAQLVKLSAEERRTAEERRDAYLAACPKVGSGEDKGKPRAVALGVYLRDKMFNYVEAVAPRSMDRQRAKQAAAESIEVAPFGPIWAGLRMLNLLQGAVEVEMPDDVCQAAISVYEVHKRTSESRAAAYLDARGIRLEGGKFQFPDGYYSQEHSRRVLQGGYPEANRLHKLAAERGRERADARYSVLADICEPVPVESDLYLSWRMHHRDMNWPFVPDPGAMRVVYFPKGGPEGLEEFENAANAVVGTERGNDHAA